MKNKILPIFIISLACVFTGSSFADVTDTTTTTTPSSTSTKLTTPTQPCKNIAAACKAAGKGKTRRDMMENCVKPLLTGNTVEGVTVSQSDIDACKTKIMNMKDQQE